VVEWEYRARTFSADKDEKLPKEYIQQAYPDWDWNDVPKHHPVALEAYLDNWGKNGWELVSVEPVDFAGKNGDLGVTYQMATNWRRAYFCVFKRPRPGTTEEASAKI
jgi:hypothetical protein